SRVVRCAEARSQLVLVLQRLWAKASSQAAAHPIVRSVARSTTPGTTSAVIARVSWGQALHNMTLSLLIPSLAVLAPTAVRRIPSASCQVAQPSTGDQPGAMRALTSAARDDPREVAAILAHLS